MKLTLFRNDSPTSIFFGMSSVVGLLFTVVYTSISLYNQDFNISYFSIIITLALVNSLLAFVLFTQSANHYSMLRDKSDLDINALNDVQKIKILEKQLSKELLLKSEIAFIMHNIHDQLRDRMSELIYLNEALLKDKNRVASNSEILDNLRISKSFNMYIVNNIKDLFDKLTNDNCSVSLKMINGWVDDNDPIISTLIRDSRSYRERYSNDSLSNDPFLWHENTAFKNILSRARSDKFYVSDNLKDESGYVNINSNWKKYYNATLVIPIRLSLGDDSDSELDESIIGFICVDNFCGRLDNSATKDLLASICDSLYLYFTYNMDFMELVKDRNEEHNRAKEAKNENLVG